MGRRRLVLDISLIARWRGTPVGFLRREQAVAKYALAARPDVAFCVLDSSMPAYREICRDRVGSLLRWDTVLDASRGARSVYQESNPIGSGDTILTVGNHAAAEGDVVAALKQRHGFGYVTMCHDLIPLSTHQRDLRVE